MGAEYNDPFTCLVKALVNQVKLAATDPSRLMRLFTDGSDNRWSEVLTQISSAEVKANILPSQE